MVEINTKRAIRLINKAIHTFKLDLSDLIVLTEAASGNFIVTPIIAALANAKKIFAITKDSYYGQASDIKEATLKWAKEIGVEQRIEVISDKSPEIIKSTDIITNLGFVRPIDSPMIELMKQTAVIPLMWETWEFRPEDLDIEMCRKKEILVLGTNEKIPELNIFRYIGMTALKLLLEMKIEVYKSKLLVVGGGIFGEETLEVLSNNGAEIKFVSKEKETREDWIGYSLGNGMVKEWIREIDAIIFVEHTYRGILLGSGGELSVEELLDLNSGISLIHICGGIQRDEINQVCIPCLPQKSAPAGFMSVTTDYVGPRPLIDLHTAGLKVGEVMARARSKFTTLNEAKQFALTHSPAMDFEEGKWKDS